MTSQIWKHMVCARSKKEKEEEEEGGGGVLQIIGQIQAFRLP